MRYDDKLKKHSIRNASSDDEENRKKEQKDSEARITLS